MTTRLSQAANLENIQFEVQSSAPSSPSSAYRRLYFTSAGMKFVDNTGTVHSVSTIDLASPGSIGDTTPGAGAFTTLSATGAVSLGSTLAVSGNAAVTGNMGVTGALAVTSTLSVTGGATLSSTLVVSGTATLDGAVNVAGAVTVAGAFTFNEVGADRDARFEGDTDANLLFTDASTDRVGIGTATPSYKLDVTGTLRATGAANFDSTLETASNLTVGNGSGQQDIYIEGGTGQFRHLLWRTGSSNRWAWLTNNDTESGTNAGSNIRLASYDDSGNFLSNVIGVTRSSGTVLIGNTLEVDGALDHDGSTVGFYGTTPTTRQSYTVSGTPLRTISAASTTANVRDVVIALVTDLKANGLLG